MARSQGTRWFQLPGIGDTSSIDSVHSASPARHSTTAPGRSWIVWNHSPAHSVHSTSAPNRSTSTGADSPSPCGQATLDRLQSRSVARDWTSTRFVCRVFGAIRRPAGPPGRIIGLFPRACRDHGPSFWPIRVRLGQSFPDPQRRVRRSARPARRSAVHAPHQSRPSVHQGRIGRFRSCRPSSPLQFVLE